MPFTRRPTLAAIASVVLLFAGCNCSEPEVIPEIDGAIDAGPDAQIADVMRLCDPETGEACPCPTVDDVRDCTTGAVGACGAGTQTCVLSFEFPTWSACVSDAEPTDEACNGVDDDCDGSTDEGLGDVSCGLGPCEVTVPACVAGVEQTCVPRPGRDETCDGTDEDCDGMVDEAMADLTCGTGACMNTVPACTTGMPGMCAPGTPGMEDCDGVDDDCDGMVDEGLGLISCGVGECRTSVAACDMGVPGTCVPLMGSMEVCNGLDDDCNGMIDDGFGTITCGVGECQRVVLDCSGTGGGTCTPGMPVPEVCDSLDNDCDTRTDESIPDVTCGVGACARTQPGCVGGTPATCTPGSPSSEVCDGVDNDCDSRTDEGIADITCGTGACMRTVAGCSGGTPGTCLPGTPGPETCGDMMDGDCDGAIDEGCGCDVTVDADFDTFNECVDCDDANGSIYPGRAEVCNGIDEDCDMAIDEDFDGDMDGYATCTTDPLLRDCDDMNPSVHPGAMEDCGPTGMGNGIDEDCDGYIDDGCNPCTTTDADGDGVTECEGDCDDMNPMISPALPEACDGLDTDCNAFTTENCGVSESCNWASGADVCEPDLICGCVVNAGGSCTGNYICTSFCEGSFTGALGSGCSATQTCPYRLTLSDNLHGCAEVTDPVGTRGAGEICSSDSECRSLNCDRYCVGPGCSTTRCVDYCSHHSPGSDGSCAPGTICEIQRLSFMSPAMYATCRLDDNGTGNTGDSCAGTTSCRWGAQSCVSGICAEPCATDAHCPSGFHCSLEGNSITVGTWGGGAPTYVSGQPAVETVPVCLSDTGAGLHNRQAGAACTRNGDCESQFCERTLNVCVGLCTSDASCPTGLGCESQYLRTPTGVLLGRVCVSSPISALLEPM